MMKTILLALALLTQLAHAIPEKNFVETWHKEVTAYFAQGHQRSFINHQGLKLNYYSFVSAQNTKTLVILPGRTEPALKYAELVYDFKDQGYNVYVLDHQGQGASDRLLEDTHKGHVKFFSDFTKDLSDWMDQVVIPETQNQDRFLIAHSMGGAIGVTYLSDSKAFKKVVLSCPMLEVNTEPYKENIGRFISGVLVFAYQGDKYAPDRGPYLPANDTFERNEVTHSPGRFAIAKAIFVTWPELVLGGPTNRWVNQSLKATKEIDALAGKVNIPILMFQSGKDTYVRPSRQNAFCSKNSNCKKIHFPTAFHEVLQEKDEIRDVVMKAIRDFLKD